jgi:membrane protease YdiL (CAAX protease family)
LTKACGIHFIISRRVATAATLSNGVHRLVTLSRSIELLSSGLVITLASHAVPHWVHHRLFGAAPAWRSALTDQIGRANVHDLLALLFALILVMGAPVRSGLRIGRVGRHWKSVLFIVALQWALTAAVYPNLPTRPFAGARIGMWLISPAAQELVFLGFLYGLFAQHWPRRLHPRSPINGALLLTAGFFSAWHLTNLLTISPTFVAFQLCYVFVLTLLSGLTRIWTGSVLYAIVVHMGVNYIAWAAG